MEGIFTEFENENALRAYPFAGGCEPDESADCIPAGIFVDAALYPVNPSGLIYLSSVSEDGMFSVSDESGVVMTGYADSNVVELFDMSDFHRHTGTIIASSEKVLEEFAGRGVLREYSSSQTAFASTCVFPIIIDGVISVSVGDTGSATGEIGFANEPDDTIRVSSGSSDGRSTLRFDVIPRIKPQEETFIKRVICVVDGQTPFRISKAGHGYNIVVLELDSIDKELVCAAAHRENSLEMVDTCECGKATPAEPEYTPEVHQLEEVYIPPDKNGSEGGLVDGAENAFYLVVPNRPGYSNPISITMEDGIVSPMTTDPEVVVNGMEADLADGAMLDKVTSKGVVIQVPGLSGGQI